MISLWNDRDIEFVLQKIKFEKSPFALPKIQAHRGCPNQKFKENTLGAIQSAFKKNLAMTEFDVQMTTDKEIVLYHDRDAQRLHKSALVIYRSTLKQLQREFAVDRLLEVLRSKERPGLLNIELKNPRVFNPVMEAVLFKILEDEEFKSCQVLFSSFNPFAIWRLAQLMPHRPRALLVTQEKSKMNHIYFRRMWFSPFLKMSYLNLDFRMLTPTLVKLLQRYNIPWAVWTVNEADQAKKCLDWGAASIISDRPSELIQELGFH